MRLSTVLLSLTLWVSLSACPDDPPVVGDVCQTVFDLCEDGLGWADQDACEDGFIGSLELGTTCVEPCLAESDCLEFASCEGECWDVNCR